MIWGVDIKIGMNMLDVISNQKDREKAKINFDRALQGDYFILTEEYGDTSLLRTFYEDHYSSVKNSEGLIVGVSVFVIDVTERKQFEMKLQNSTLRLENIIQATNVGTWEWNVQTGETIFNEEWAKIIGYSIEELTPISIKTWEYHTNPDDLRLSKELLEDHFAGKNPYYDCEFRMKHKDGHWVWVHDRGKIINRSNDGKPLMMFGTHTDISKRKEAEKKMQESEEKYRTLFTTEQDALFLIDKETLAILDVNDAASILYGYSRDEILKLKNTDMSAEPEVTKLLTKQFMERIELRYHKKKDGTIFPVDISSSKFKHRNRDVILASVRDITNRVQSDLHIKEINEKLAKLNSEKDKFFTIIAHDLKSPFNSIMGFSELLVEQVNAKDYDGIEKYAEIIQYSSRRALDLLMNLMEWSQSQTGRMEFNPEYFELQELIKETELLLNGAIEQKSISLSKTIPINLSVFADKKMMATVLRNLISNAIKFTHTGGKISISVEEKPDEMLVSISDTGVGISRDNIEKLFNIGETYSTSGTLNETGTGLGLILCKEFVEKHGRKIWAESEEGKGSTFCFTIPMNIS
jgi:PAS domain S-box-containing protein